VAPDYGRTGVYLQGGIVYGFEDFDDDGIGGHDIDESVGLDVRAGYRTHEHLAVEVQFQQFSDFGVDDADLEVWAASLNGKAFLSSGRVQPYFLGGVGYAQADLDGPDGDEGAFAGRVAAGVDGYITENCGLSGELGYILPSDDLEDLNIMPVSLSAFWRF
jgi:opacity protein-like surface antigen